MKTTGVILAGGKSRRFGSDKARLMWDGVTLTEHLASRLRPVFDEVLIVGSAGGRGKFSYFSIPGVREITDLYPGSGPLGGIHAGLCAAAGERVFVTACDMPFFDAELALRLLALADAEENCDAVVPVENKILQTLFAVYSRSVLPVIERMLENGERAVYSLLGRVRTKYVELCSCGRGFYNINYPEDYRKD